MVIPTMGYCPDIPGRPKQVIPRSDWPIYAAVSALAAGTYFGPLAANGEAVLREWLKGQDIPDERLNFWLQSLSGKKIMLPESAPGVHRFDPEEYQTYAASEMSDSGGILGMACGLGKTLTAEIFVNAVAPKLQGKPLVIPTTLTAFDAWKPYLPRFKALGFSDVMLTSIDSLHKFEPGFRSDGGAMILDEGHLLGSVGARRTKHALKLRLKMDAGLVLTGTLFHGGIIRALTCMNLAVPGLGAFASGFSAATYFNCVQDVHVGDKTYKKIVKPSGEDFERFKNFVSKRFVCSLSKKSPIVQQSVIIPEQDQESVHFDGPWGTIHHDSVKEIRRAIEANEGIPHASAVTKKLARTGLESKILYLLDQLSDGAPTVIFAQYHESLDEIERNLVEAGITFTRVDGGVTGADRSNAIATFQAGTAQVFLGQMEASGISVELTRANRSFATDVSWRPDAYDQALARTCRRGQSHRCTHTDLLANRLQERIVDTVRSGKAFDASITEYQDIARARKEFDA